MRCKIRVWANLNHSCCFCYLWRWYKIWSHRRSQSSNRVQTCRHSLNELLFNRQPSSRISLHPRRLSLQRLLLGWKEHQVNDWRRWLEPQRRCWSHSAERSFENHRQKKEHLQTESRRVCGSWENLKHLPQMSLYCWVFPLRRLVAELQCGCHPSQCWSADCCS